MSGCGDGLYSTAMKKRLHGARRIEQEEVLQNRNQKFQVALAELSKKIDVGNDVLLEIKKINEDAADAYNEYRLLQMLDKDSQE